MRKFYFVHYLFILVISLFVIQPSKAQCVVNSSTGYHVTISVTPVSVIVPSSCPWGYNYNLKLNYNISFSGNNIPANLYSLQGNMYCSGQANFFSLPLNGGVGQVTSGSNPWRNTTDCSTASFSSLGCNSLVITIHGPGIPTQTLNNCLQQGGTLPVNLVSFNGRILGSAVALKWETANETGNKSFTVERSTDGSNWQPIKTISGAGNSSVNRIYEYTDASLANGTYYYRLRQTDISGSIAYSNVIAANITAGISNDITVTSIQPNRIQLGGLTNPAEWELAVISSNSAIVFNSASLTSSSVQLPNLASGIYFVQLRNKLSGTQKTLKFLNR